ncbi:MAG: UDP-N-acetylmuramoyl-tripeptide--D-alanyl-D-alanine ligase, partial [Pyramidobacter sp.]|nr:UDP-N-acetylmuramoyl-tripeptide--D-alanyl-D-alanine ligase [Pyramidobacter sp.]
MKLSEIAKKAGVELRGPDRELPLCVRVASRQVAAGEGFVALRGEHADGHRFIEDVLKNGASLVICEASKFQDAWQTAYPECSFVLAPDRCEYAVARLASAYAAALPELKEIVAITGSVGKTSTKNYTRALLEDHFRLHVAGGNYNTLIGCGVTVLAAPPDTQILLLEMGANHKGEIAEMVSSIPPTLAAVTEVVPVHLEGFGSLAGILDAKSEIFASKALRCAVVNGDNAFLSHRANELGLPGVIRFGRSGDVYFLQERLSWKKDHFYVDAILTGLDGISFKVSLPLSGVQQLYPLCCACAIAGRLGLSSRDIAAALPKCRSSAGRGEVKLSGSGAAIVDECYNASPAAMKASLASMSAPGIPGRRILVLGEMLELGEAA